MLVENLIFEVTRKKDGLKYINNYIIDEISENWHSYEGISGEIYNKKFKPSKIENICDKCNVSLKTRDDDTEEVAKKRFDTYYEQTAPLVKFYEDKKVLYKIDANGSIDEVWERLLKVI